LSDDVVGSHQHSVDADALVKSSTVIYGLCHPLGYPILVAKTFGGITGAVSLLADILPDCSVSVPDLWYDNISTVWQMVGSFAGSHHPIFERLQLGVINTSLGVLRRQFASFLKRLRTD
jgi:hypothetical protein